MQVKRGSTILMQRSLHGKGVLKSVQLAVEKIPKPPVQSSKITTELKLPSSSANSPKYEANDPNKSSTLPNYIAEIPFDESLGKFIPDDKKDELILKLVSRLKELQNRSNYWTDWANEKVMQATRKLSNDMPELKMLRKEKEEAEISKKEAKVLEENTVKRQSEMENALSNATEHVLKSNTMIGKLESERFYLKRQMESAETHAKLSAASSRKALEMEKKMAQRVQEMNKEKNILQEELISYKKKTTNLQQEISKAEQQYKKIQARCNKERMETEKYEAEAAGVNKERERIEANAKAQEEEIMEKGESQKKMYLINIKQLENRLALLKYNAECAKIAALRRSQSGGGGGLSEGGVRRDMECVMCLEEEKSVVFLPCAHQVLCVECNQKHQEQGMNDCPSCRTPIHRRINVRLPRSNKRKTASRKAK